MPAQNPKVVRYRQAAARILRVLLLNRDVIVARAAESGPRSRRGIRRLEGENPLLFVRHGHSLRTVDGTEYCRVPRTRSSWPTNEKRCDQKLLYDIATLRVGWLGRFRTKQARISTAASCIGMQIRYKERQRPLGARCPDKGRASFRLLL